MSERELQLIFLDFEASGLIATGCFMAEIMKPQIVTLGIIKDTTPLSRQAISCTLKCLYCRLPIKPWK